MPDQKPIRLFFSYSHKDEKLRGQLEAHLSTLKQQNLIDGWYDRKIGAGKEIDGAISENLEAARIILLLISADFLASDYCYSKEMTRALEKHREGTSRVIPVILRPVDWQSSPVGDLLALPKDGKAITKWRVRDDGWLDVAKGIRKAVDELKSQPLSAPGISTQDETVSPPEDDKVRSIDDRSLDFQFIALHQPDLFPVGARFGDIDKGRLGHEGDHFITLQNQGESMPSDVYVVLFPSVRYIENESMPQRYLVPQDTYWHGGISVVPAPGERCEIRLQAARAPLRGTMSMIPQHTLYAPIEPKLGLALRGLGDFYSARLTVTFRDRVGRILASVFDLDAHKLTRNLDNVWVRVTGPTEVEHDLRKVMRQAALDRQPPRNELPPTSGEWTWTAPSSNLYALPTINCPACGHLQSYPLVRASLTLGVMSCRRCGITSRLPELPSDFVLPE